MSRLAGMLVATVISIGLLGPSAASGAGLTLSVTSLSNPPATALTGGSLKVSYKVARQGSGLRGATLAFYLSPTKNKGRTAIRLSGGGSLAALKKKTSVKGTAKPTVPATARLGSYYLLACVERISPRQGRAKPACRASKRKVRIKRGPMRGIATPNPLTVSPVLDDARASTATIGSAGGTVTATAENGTVFTLTVPDGALAGETEITMTPLASIGGLPFDGLVGGVDLKPDGLRFYKPVTLTFEPSSPVPLGRQAPFMYSGSGRDFHSYPLVRDPTKLEMTLTHFTGAGVAEGSQAQQNAQENRAPANPEGQWEQRAAELIDDLREGRDEDFRRKFEALNREYYNVVLKPLLKAAETNDELGEHAISTFLGWARQLMLLGFDESFEAEMDAGFESMRRILENAYRKAFERCVGGEIGQIQRLLGLARQAELLGYSFGQDISEKLDRCVRFSLDYEANLYYESLYSGGDYLERGDLQVRTAAAPLRLNFANGRVEGDVPLTVESWEWFDYLCPRYGGTATPTRAGFAQLTVEIGNPIEQRRPDGSVRTTFPPPKILGLLLDPGAIATRNDCGNGGDGSSGSREGFAGGFYPRVLRTVFAHLQSPIGGLYMINPWTFVGDDPWAEFTDSRRVQQSERSHSLGRLRLRLHHTPQR